MKSIFIITVMLLYKNSNNFEICIDEAGRGCMAGPVYAAAVIWPNHSGVDSSMIKDSKKISAKKREIVAAYIEKTAVAYGIGYASAEEIDKFNILEATYMAMHRAVSQIENERDLSKLHTLLVDGKWFKPYWLKSGNVLEHTCIVKGDSTYTGIAAASILAKVNHDRHIKRLCREYPQYTLYNWEKNMCYGTKSHMQAIKENGISHLHRKTFGICAHSPYIKTLRVDL